MSKIARKLRRQRMEKDRHDPERVQHRRRRKIVRSVGPSLVLANIYRLRKNNDT